VNKYFDETKPWVLAKEGNMERLGTVLYNTLEALLKVSLMTLPIMPDTSREVFKRIGFHESENKEHLEKWGVLKSSSSVSHGKPLFEKIDLEKFEKVVRTVSVEKETNMITIEDFSKVDLRVAKILVAERIPKSKKLVRLEIDLGDLGKRQIVAGIAEFYKPEDLIGKLIVVVANLKPAKLMGYESQGMLLAAQYGDDLKLITIDGDITPGAKVS